MRLARIQTPLGPRPVVQDGSKWAVVKDLFADEPESTGEFYPVDGAQLLAPAQPMVVLGMAHNNGPSDRLLAPQAFSKSARSVVGPGQAIELDTSLGEINIEGELAVVIGRSCRRLTPEQVPGVILGYCIGNDVTNVDQASLDEKATQVKNGDGYTPLGPWIETELDADHVHIDVRLDGKPVASSNTDRLAWAISEQLVALTRYLTLGPGDVLLTGSPTTWATITPGQQAEITIEGIGTLSNPAIAVPQA
ncbi:2-keto-4-pentenoate hydratase/2-oxohepta-3-ene-1,7-dioic acid hydratase (catechol pathway) [Propionibacterium cyclohexanicum]|uniref:2-keto-4-pentenoate hydratase/2-oxohepta-3-ene-1,7-dioic acid hydratase (Catechol pathway) n=1 Tax=Propionibacterium cyclohexanicum TaxID=64702 RepID=A0A1H9T997_9ACTN|nr:fumarylacetoacetate hydrolase family protein [Propionibacterium cyclohexanicum]SER93203.1 2-keto-4-pentenoate hydratase/2-oxohepta-3-ene-1,7-dioic acid hydratase (catechol pathway) [Propionibacterium cyclohexanicum]